MKKQAVFILIVALSLVLTACTTSSGLLLKEATIKQLDLQSFESHTDFTVDIDTALFKNTYGLEADTKQLDMFNSSVDFHIGADLLALAGLTVQPTEDGKVTISLLTKDSESIITTSQDEIGLQLSDSGAMLEEELGEGKQEEFNQLMVTLQDTMRGLMKEYVEEYGYTFDQITNNGTVTVVLPTGEAVETEHVEVEMTVLDTFEMLQYSLNYFLENEEFQNKFYDSIADLPEMFVSFAQVEDVDSTELEATDMEAMKTEVNTAIEGFIGELEKIKTDYLLEYEEELNELATIQLGMFIGKEDKETYQTEFTLQLDYTEKIASLELEGLEGLPFAPGDSITISSVDQYWNHNKDLDPIEVPSQLVTTEELMDMENVEEELKALAGDDSLLAQMGEFLQSMVAPTEFGFVELRVDENQVETLDGIQPAELYVKDGQLMAPLALLNKALGNEVEWNAATHQVIVNGNGHLVEASLKDNTVTLDGQVHADIVVEAIEGISYVNVRPYAEAMGWDVLWNEETNATVLLQ